MTLGNSFFEDFYDNSGENRIRTETLTLRAGDDPVTRSATLRTLEDLLWKARAVIAHADLEREAQRLLGGARAQADSGTEGGAQLYLAVGRLFAVEVGHEHRSKFLQAPEELREVAALLEPAGEVADLPVLRQELLARVRAALRRGGEPADGAARDRTITGAAGLRIDIGRHEVHVGSQLLALTKTEFNILEALAAVKGRVVTKERLLAAAWPNKATPDPLLLKPHVARLRGKLAEAGGPLPESVRGVGYRLGAG